MRTIFLEQLISGWRVKVLDGQSLHPIALKECFLLTKAVAEFIVEGRLQPTASMVLLPESERPVVLRSGRSIVDEVEDGFLHKGEDELTMVRKIYSVMHQSNAKDSK